MTDLCSVSPPGLLSLEEALSALKTSIEPIRGTEIVSLKMALGRIIFEPVHSPMNIPSFRNSSMDGYAFYSGDIDVNRPFTLQLSGTSWAGSSYQGKCLPGQCIRIFTGAVIPEGTDSVIMQEQVILNDNLITLPANTKPGQHIRMPGEDIRQGSLLITSGKKLSAIDLGLLASAGIYHLCLKRKLKIAFFSTGDELTAIGKSLEPGEIYDSNRYTLGGLLENHAYDVCDLGVIKDDPQLLKSILSEASKCYDAIITTGGASVGEADYIKQVLDQIGTVNFWKIAMKPGKPLAYGKIGASYFFGLPGNPVSVIATYQQFVIPALQQLSGMKTTKPLRLRAQCASHLKKSAGRLEFQRGVLSQIENDVLSVESAGKQESHILSAICKANCYIVLSADCQGVQPGEWVEVEPFATYL